MENTLEHVLLSWRMPEWKQWATGLSCIVLAAIVGLLDGVVAPAARFAVWMVFWGLIVMWLGGFTRTASGFRCMEAGIELRLLPGPCTKIPWEDVNTLRHLTGPLVVLDLQQRWYVFLGIPKPVLNQLIAILREATNARIIGFD